MQHLFPYVYKHYKVLAQKRDTSYLKQFFAILFVIVFTISGVASGLFYYYYKKEAPIRAQNKYVFIAQSSYFAINGSFDELLTNFMVLGATTSIDQEAATSEQITESSKQIMDKINSAKENIAFSHNLLINLPVPAKYEDLNSKIINFGQTSFEALDKLEKQYLFINQLLELSPSKFYFPTLAADQVWQSQNKQEIINYLQNLNKELDISMENLAKLQTPEEFTEYVNLQSEYFQLDQKVIELVIVQLEEPDTTDTDLPTQIEVAHQILTVAKNQNQQKTDLLIQNRQEILGLRENLDKFAQVRLLGANLTEEINSQSSALQQTKTDKYIDKIEYLIRKII